ncbi:hypothetical protein ACDP63_11470 [Paracoccus sp. P2]|uniref:Uncharacterized protein n=1 Tax=Paracoccus pantotrophus TaxID=82367 RepID=A0A7H9BTV0_PARPN|nr:hypothetical protein [Paracoccus pantotrophus]MDF3853587.1 hypothetical protein [Paracoccus pantotrophus]QLH14256.1 hypothetical protein HYQ43_14875 [Paracoccus pantotrophus]
MDFKPLGLKRRDFPPDEAVRGAGVGIDQITDSQGGDPFPKKKSPRAALLAEVFGWLALIFAEQWADMPYYRKTHQSLSSDFRFLWHY